jgi:hypothetical protein
MRLREPLDDAYFRWLCAKVLKHHDRMYHDLLLIMYKTEFVWLVSGDQHREADGVELRYDFRMDTNTEKDDIWEAQPCSVLELFIAFANRASFQNDEPVKTWFWRFMENLMLDQFRQVSDSDVPIIEDIIDTFIWRTYDSHGRGGMFPMTQTNNDQRTIELWYQFFEYLDEMELC